MFRTISSYNLLFGSILDGTVGLIRLFGDFGNIFGGLDAQRIALRAADKIRWLLANTAIGLVRRAGDDSLLQDQMDSQGLAARMVLVLLLLDCLAFQALFLLGGLAGFLRQF